jgi:hypothetical protein
MAHGSQMLNFARSARLTEDRMILEAGKALEQYAVFSSLLAELMKTGQYHTGAILLRFIRECLGIDPEHPPSAKDPRITLIKDRSIQYEPAHVLLQSVAGVLFEALQSGADLTQDRADGMFAELYHCVVYLGSAQDVVQMGFEEHFRQFFQA